MRKFPATPKDAQIHQIMVRTLSPPKLDAGITDATVEHSRRIPIFYDINERRMANLAKALVQNAALASLAKQPWKAIWHRTSVAKEEKEHFVPLETTLT